MGNDNSPHVNRPRCCGMKSLAFLAGVALYFAAKHVYSVINGASLVSYDSIAASVSISGLAIIIVEIVRRRGSAAASA